MLSGDFEAVPFLVHGHLGQDGLQLCHQRYKKGPLCLYLALSGKVAHKRGKEGRQEVRVLLLLNLQALFKAAWMRRASSAETSLSRTSTIEKTWPDKTGLALLYNLASEAAFLPTWCLSCRFLFR